MVFSALECTHRGNGRDTPIHEKNGQQDIVDIISRLSPVAWQHINLNGEYSFTKEKKEIDLVGLLSDIEPLEVQNSDKIV